MAGYKISEQADNDLADHYKYGIETFGISQAQNYLIPLHETFQNLAKNPDLGRDATQFSLGLPRYSYKAYAIFFKQMENGILIIRFLGQKMGFEDKF